MSKLLLLYGYNNYFNRIIKKEQSLSDYKTAVGTGNFVELADTNFNVTDGVSARHVFNTSSFLDGKSPDYLVREYNGQLQRWFVLEAVKIMGNQIQVSLRRDLVSDFSEQIKNAPAFIQKGILQSNSPLIFNNEGMKFNEIKKKEYLLKDKSKSAWIVGYLARSENPEETLEGKEISTQISYVANPIDYDDLPESLQNAIDSGEAVSTENFELNIKLFSRSIVDGDINYFYLIKNKNFPFETTFSAYLEYYQYIGGANSVYFCPNPKTLTQSAPDIKPSYFKGGLDELFVESILSDEDLEDLSNDLTISDAFNFNNKFISKDGKIYKLVISEIAEEVKENSVNYAELDTTQFGLKIKQLRKNLVDDYHWDDRELISQTKPVASYEFKFKKYFVQLTETTSQTISFTIPEGYNKLNDSPYDMFCIPLSSDLNFKFPFDDDPFYKIGKIVGEAALPLARAIKEQLGTFVYDIQILPFCPIPEIIEEENLITIKGIDSKNYAKVIVGDDQDNPISAVYFCTSSKGTYNIDVTDIEELKFVENTIDRKIASETIKARLVSPNFSGSFDFNPQKNNGVGLINIDYNCKPYTPYIHVSPLFSGLYGNDFNDARGLICGGDFSISTASSKWEEYQIQNKNFENIFNRQIENMDVNNSIAMEKEIYTATIGAISSGVSGAVGGAITGSNIPGIGTAAGAIAGGLVNATLSTIGAIKDVELLGRQQSENRDYAVDMYTYNLQNIQALPYTISKVSTFNENNKIFPFIEIYDCTDVEKQNLRDKIKYNGMTVMVQGQIKDFIVEAGDYVQAKLIRLENIDEDNHAVTEIYNELMKGVYIYAW